MSLVVEEQQAHTWQAVKSKAQEYFKCNGFPTKKDEAWKYTSLRHLDEAFLESNKNIKKCNNKIQNILKDSYYLFVVDGIIDLNSSFIPKQVIIEACIEGEISSDYHKLNSNNDFNQQPHVAINKSNTQQIINIKLLENQQLDKPLEIHYYVSREACNSLYTQLWLQLEQKSKITIVECFYGDIEVANNKKDARVMHNHLAYINLAKNADLTHYKIQNLPDDVILLYTANCDLYSNCRCNSFCLNKGGKISRQEVRNHLLGENIHCDQSGITLGSGNQHHDVYLPVNHFTSGSYSNQHFRQLLNDSATGIFYGNVYVAQDSIKTEAHQLNKNLILSPSANVFTRPELDILADDVICTHGATIGNLDEEAIYYMQTRGLNEEEAYSLLIKGFIEELVVSISNNEINNYVREIIQQWAKK